MNYSQPSMCKWHLPVQCSTSRVAHHRQKFLKGNLFLSCKCQDLEVNKNTICNKTIRMVSFVVYRSSNHCTVKRDYPPCDSEALVLQHVLGTRIAKRTALNTTVKDHSGALRSIHSNHLLRRSGMHLTTHLW